MIKKNIAPHTMYINGVDVLSYGVLVEQFSVGGTKVKNETYQGMNRTSFNLLSSQFGTRPISVSLFISAHDRRSLTLKKSKVDSLMWGKLELALPDGFLYTATLVSAGELAILGQENNQVIGLCSYTFEGIQHDDLVTHTGNKVFCESTMPYTDCRLTGKANRAYSSLTIGTVTITGVSTNDIIVVDGINGRILQNGGPCAGNMSFVHFPSLVPGENNITSPLTLTVEYYPTYI